MERERRLRRSGDFAAVHEQGRSWAHPLLVVRARPGGHGASRVGFSVSRRVGAAVVRNRVRRRLREIVRRTPLRPAFDVVVIARAAAAEASFEQLAEAARVLFRRARLFVDSAKAAPEVER